MDHLQTSGEGPAYDFDKVSTKFEAGGWLRVEDIHGPKDQGERRSMRQELLDWRV